jgi:hypothetical protein
MVLLCFGGRRKYIGKEEKTTQDTMYEVRNTVPPKEKNNQKPKNNKETATSTNQPTTLPP